MLQLKSIQWWHFNFRAAKLCSLPYAIVGNVEKCVLLNMRGTVLHLCFAVSAQAQRIYIYHGRLQKTTEKTLTERAHNTARRRLTINQTKRVILYVHCERVTHNARRVAAAAICRVTTTEPDELVCLICAPMCLRSTIEVYGVVCQRNTSLLFDRNVIRWDIVQHSKHGQVGQI